MAHRKGQPLPQRSLRADMKAGLCYKWSSSTRHATLIGGICLSLMGCQSTAALSASEPANLIDFSVSDPALTQAQSKAFQHTLQRNQAAYQQLFDQSAFPDSDTQAKNKLISALRQHLATEHVAVAKARYHLTPFIAEGSIDAGADSLFNTVLDIIDYQNSHAEDEAYSEEKVTGDDVYYDEETNAYYYIDDAGEVTVIEEAAAAVAAADSDEEGYDSDADDGAADYADHEEGSFLTRNNPKRMLATYEEMQAAKQDNAKSETGIGGMGSLTALLSMSKKTPEQVAAANAYQYQYLTLNSVSQYKPAERQYNSVYSYDYAAPTVSGTIQLPFAIDFNNSRVSVDPSALMPLMALIDPENTPLPDQMISKTVDLGLPASITSQIPPAIIYDASIAAMQDSIAELDPELFSLIDIQNDDFAKQIGAAQGIKVYFGSKQSGELIGKIFKHISTALERYVDAHPEAYPDNHGLKNAIKKVQLYNKGYQSGDIGSLLQLIEAVVPISFNQVNYYYLDQAGHLLGKQQRINLGSDLIGMQSAMLNQIRYDHNSFSQHALTPLLEQSFGSKAPKSIDGNAWLQQIKLSKQKQSLAQAAREEYFYIDATCVTQDEGTDDDDYHEDEAHNDCHKDSYDKDSYGPQ